MNRWILLHAVCIHRLFVFTSLSISSPNRRSSSPNRRWFLSVNRRWFLSPNRRWFVSLNWRSSSTPNRRFKAIHLEKSKWLTQGSPRAIVDASCVTPELPMKVIHFYAFQIFNLNLLHYILKFVSDFNRNRCRTKISSQEDSYWKKNSWGKRYKKYLLWSSNLIKWS